MAVAATLILTSSVVESLVCEERTYPNPGSGVGSLSLAVTSGASTQFTESLVADRTDTEQLLGGGGGSGVKHMLFMYL